MSTCTALSQTGTFEAFKLLPDDRCFRFTGQGSWEALEAAEAWCRRHDISMGPAARGSPRGLVKGKAVIAHWAMLDARQRALLDGAMISHSLEWGPVVARIRKRSADIRILRSV